jgi:hypothetical protein
MKTRREVMRGAAIGAAAVSTASLMEAMQIDRAKAVGGEFHRFSFEFFVPGDRTKAQAVMAHFQRFIETSEDEWPSRNVGVNTSKIVPL